MYMFISRWWRIISPWPAILVFVAIGRTLDVPNMEIAIEGAKLGDALITSGKGRITREQILSDYGKFQARQYLIQREAPSDAATVIESYIKEEIFFAFKQKKIRCDIRSLRRLPSGRKYDMYWQQSFDGEKTMLLRLDATGPKGLIEPMGSIKSGNDIPQARDPRYWGMTIFGTPVKEFLEGRPFGICSIPIGKPLLLKSVQLDGVLCDVVRTKLSRDYTITVWLARTKAYRPKRIEVADPNGQVITIVSNTFRSYGGDLWFPKQVVAEKYAIDKVTGKRELHSRTTLIVHDDFMVNIDLPDEMFEIRFPKGLEVYDFRIGKTFIAE